MVPTIIPQHAQLIRYLFFFASGLISAHSIVVGRIHSIAEWLASSGYARQAHKPGLRPCVRVLVIFLMALPSLAYSANSAFGEEHKPAQVTSGWFTGGVGGGAGTKNLSGIGSYVALSLALNENRLLSFRSSGVTEFDIFGSISPDESSTDYGVLYGMRTSGQHLGYLSVSAGLSLVSSVKRGRFLSSSGGWLFGTSSYETVQKYTIGIPFEGQAVFKPFDFIGVGLVCFGNINPERSFVGAALGLYLGDLR